jgi:DNA-binding XRE family transcriptional regulator
MSNKHEQLKKAWADELRAWREKRNYTQVEAAKKLKVPERTLEEWEQERTMPAHLGPLRALMR